MTGPAAQMLAEQMSLHLRKDEFETCREILNAAEEESTRKNKGTCLIEAIAELPIPLEAINKLEEEGYIYLRDLDGVDLQTIMLEHFNPRRMARIRRAIVGARQRNANRIRRTETKRLAAMTHSDRRL